MPSVNVVVVALVPSSAIALASFSVVRRPSPLTVRPSSCRLSELSSIAFRMRKKTTQRPTDDDDDRAGSGARGMAHSADQGADPGAESPNVNGVEPNGQPAGRRKANRVVIVAVGGPTCSGKTTYAPVVLLARCTKGS